MDNIFERAEQGDINAFYDLLSLLYTRRSQDLFKWAQKAVSIDPVNPYFLNYMGLCYEEGHGTACDREKAKIYYRKAAEAGYNTAAYNLAGILSEENSPETFEWANKAYETGNKTATVYIARCYELGLGTEKNEGLAFEWCLKGAEAGAVIAQDILAHKYLEGNGCSKNISEAMEWLRTAADSGYSVSAAELSRLYRSNQFFPADMEEAVHYAVMAAEGEQPQWFEIFAIADMYRDGTGVEKDIQKALRLYKIAADNGEVHCMHNVGVLYSKTEYGIPRNIDKAITYFEKAGKLGYVKAFENLKNLYKEKYPDNFKEYYWAQISEWAKDNNPGVLTELGLLYCDKTEPEYDPEKGIEYIKQAADAGNPYGLFLISKYYMNIGHPDAEKYLKLSIEKGNTGSKTILGKLYVSQADDMNKKMKGISLLKEVAKEINDPEAMLCLGEYEDKEKWWTKSAELGNRNAAYKLSEMYIELNKYKDAETWIKKGIEQNDPIFINLYADMLHDGITGTEEERNKEYIYYEKTADMGDVYGAEMAAVCYLYGEGGAPQNKEKAIKLLHFVIEKETSEARCAADVKLNLAMAYKMGGSTQNFDLAVKYFKEGLNEYSAEKTGLYENSVIELSDIYIRNNRERLGFDLLKKNVNMGLKRCNYYLAICYIDGIGTEKNYDKAENLLEDALKSSDLDENEKQAVEEMRNNLLMGVYGTDRENKPENSEIRKAEGCYIATCVYGSYDCPNVWVLRRFRDYKLSHSAPGRLFIRGYYAISPVLVKHFGSEEWFRKMWAGILDPCVGLLRRKGYSDKKYED